MIFEGEYWYEVWYVERRTYKRKSIVVPGDSIQHAKEQLEQAPFCYEVMSYSRRVDGPRDQ